MPVSNFDFNIKSHQRKPNPVFFNYEYDLKGTFHQSAESGGALDDLDLSKVFFVCCIVCLHLGT